MRERWFYVQSGQRRGPFSLAEVVAAVQGEPDPRSVLVWRKGLRQWTLAEATPEVRQQLARATAPEEVRRSAVSAAEAPQAPKPAHTSALVRLGLGLAAFAAVAGIAALALQLRSSEPALRLRRPETTISPAVTRAVFPPAAAGPTPPPARLPATPRPSGAPALAAAEADLPVPELRKLRGVAAWSGETLKLTVYNATAWRLTELRVRVERFSGEDFVADEQPITLTPQSPRVDAGVADLLARVAPDRKRPGLNSLDTGPFEARAGAAPEGFRWEIESARGYPPAR
jgi:hypothetical protein